MALDNFRTQKIIWDRANKKIFEAIEANSGDSNGRKLVVQVINQEVTEGLSGTTLSLGWKSRKGAKGLDAFNVVDASKGIFEIYYTTEMLSNIGNLEASLILIDSTGRIESSTFTISIRPSTIDDESVESENSFTALTEALVKVNDFDARLAQTVKQGQNESITKAMLSQEIKNDLNNGEIDFRLNTSEIEDGAITKEKTNFIHKSSNLFNKDTVTDGYRLNLTTGELLASDNHSVSDFIEVEPEKDYYFKGVRYLVRFDEKKVRIHGNEILPTGETTSTTPSTKYIRVALPTSNLSIGQINKGSEQLPYEPHLTYLSPDISISRKNIYDDETFEDDGEAIKDGAITIEKTNFIHKSSNLFDRNNLIQGQVLNLSTGELEPNDGFLTSDFIKVEPNQTYYVNGIVRFIRYDENRKRIGSNEPAANEYIILSGTASFVRASTRLQYLNESQISKTVSDATSTRVPEPNEVVPYEPYFIYLSPEISISRENIYGDEKTSNYMDKHSRLYKTELLSGRDRSADSDEMIAMFDDLIGLNGFTDYQIEKKIWGQDDFGNDLISYSATKTNMENDFGLERFKVGFLTGTHGNEKGPVVSLLYFLKDLLSNEKNNEMFDIVHSLVDFHWFPLVNPSGWDSNTRVNGSGVNINRNFTTHWEITNDTDKGNSPASEPETQAVESWMADNMFDILIDVHTTVDIDNSWFAADHTTDEGIGFIKDYYRTRSILSKWWGDREDIEFPENTVMGHVNQYNSKLAQTWQHANEIGINTCLLELASRYTPDTQTDGPVTITFGAETIGNLMLETLKRKRVI